MVEFSSHPRQPVLAAAASARLTPGFAVFVSLRLLENASDFSQPPVQLFPELVRCRWLAESPFSVNTAFSLSTLRIPAGLRFPLPDRGIPRSCSWSPSVVAEGSVVSMCSLLKRPSKPRMQGTLMGRSAQPGWDVSPGAAGPAGLLAGNPRPLGRFPWLVRFPQEKRLPGSDGSTAGGQVFRLPVPSPGAQYPSLGL